MSNEKVFHCFCLPAAAGYLRLQIFTRTSPARAVFEINNSQ